MKASKIYRAAAKLVEEGKEKFPCLAVRACDPKYGGWQGNCELAAEFIITMSPGKMKPKTGEAASDRYLNRIHCGSEQGINHNVLALCFMAAIAESEGR